MYCNKKSAAPRRELPFRGHSAFAVSSCSIIFARPGIVKQNSQIRSIIAFVCGFITRILDGKILAAILRLVLGWNIIWLIDLILMIVSKHILRIIPI